MNAIVVKTQNELDAIDQYTANDIIIDCGTLNNPINITKEYLYATVIVKNYSVINLYNNARVNIILNFAIVNEMWNNSKIYVMLNQSKVINMYDNSKVLENFDDSCIENNYTNY